MIASADDDGEIMAVEHREHPVVGVQFHPESAATEYGYAMLDRFLHGDRARTNALPTGADLRDSVHRDGGNDAVGAAMTGRRVRAATGGSGAVILTVNLEDLRM